MQVDDLSVDYLADGEMPRTVLRDVHFTVDAGEAVGLCGASGSGKTTLLLALSGLLPSDAQVTSGAAWLDAGQRRRHLDLTVASCLDDVRGKTLGLIYQEPDRALHPLLSIADQIAEVLRAHSGQSWRHCRQEAAHRLDEVGLGSTGVGQAFPHQLSGGQRQRVVIAQAMACRPALLLADEPTAALDPLTRRDLIDLLADLRQRHGMSVLWISHDLEVLRRATDRQLAVQDLEIRPLDVAASVDRTDTAQRDGLP